MAQPLKHRQSVRHWYVQSLLTSWHLANHNSSDFEHSRGAGASYSRGVRAPPLLTVGDEKSTGLEQLQMVSGKVLALFH